MPGIAIKRANEFADMVRSYKVELDGEVVGKVKSGETFSYELPSGMHSLKLRIDWKGSNTVAFEISDGEVFHFNVRNNMHYPSAGLLYMTIWRNKYLWLEQS